MSILLVVTAEIMLDWIIKEEKEEEQEQEQEVEQKEAWDQIQKDHECMSIA